MNAVANNTYTQTLHELGMKIPRPKAILCISAHWMTKGTYVTHMQNPKTIHDFYGFPKELFDIQYPAHGNPDVAELIKNIIKTVKIKFNEDWGLDHGTWSILKHMYPNADIPVLQLSLDMDQSVETHFKIGQDLQALREQGVLIIGSGNIVHNLKKINFQANAKSFEWATEFDSWVRSKIIDRDFTSIMHDALESNAGQLSIPTMEHWYPLIYILGSAHTDEQLNFIYEGIEHGSISMLSFSLG